MKNHNSGPHGPLRFRVASLGGTFEAMHQGHLDYLDLGFSLADHVIITLTVDTFAQRWKSYKVSPTEDRKERLVLALKELEIDPERYELLVARRQEEVTDILMRPDLDLVVCIKDYGDALWNVNKSRRDAGIPEYYLLVKPETRQGQRILSSTDILQGVLPFDENGLDDLD